MTLTPTEETARLKRRFMGFVAAQVVAVVLCAGLLAGYFGFRIAACLPAFAFVLLCAVGAQLAFILAFRRDVGTTL